MKKTIYRVIGIFPLINQVELISNGKIYYYKFLAHQSVLQIKIGDFIKI